MFSPPLGRRTEPEALKFFYNRDVSKNVPPILEDTICFWHQALFACGSSGRVPWNVKAFMGKILHDPMYTAVPQFWGLSVY